MSVTQVKKQFEELAAYLGRDVHGIEKLRKLKESFTELRTQLAEAIRSREVAYSNMEAVFADKMKATDSLEEATKELHSLRQRVENIRRELNAERSSSDRELNDADEASDSRVATNVQRQYRAMIKELRRRIHYCPSPIAKPRLDKNTLYFDRDSLAKGWSHSSIWSLGAAVAVLSSIQGGVGVVSTDSLWELEPADEDTEKQKHQTIQWLRKIMDLSEDEDPIRNMCHSEAVKEGINILKSRAR